MLVVRHTKFKLRGSEVSDARTDITYRGTVYPWQCDHMGHMNVMWYVGKFDEATWQLIASLGMTPSRATAEQIGGAAVDQHLEYKRELRAGDLITVRSTVVEVSDRSMRFFHEMRNDETGEIAATATIVGICIDLKVRKSRSWPPGVRERAALMVQQGFSGALAD